VTRAPGEEYTSENTTRISEYETIVQLLDRVGSSESYI
jgi:hypothetical protein